jgi:hypothetical protein
LFSKFDFLPFLKNPCLSWFKNNTPQSKFQALSQLSLSAAWRTQTRHSLTVFCILDTFHAFLGYLIFDVSPKKSHSPSWPLSL